MNRHSPETHDRKSRVAALSITSNAALVAVKLAGGLAMGSVSVISEAIHSAVDLAAAVIAFLSVRSAAKPPDRKHPFGHGKFENLSGAVEALLIFAAAGWIIREAILKLIAPHPMERAGLGAALMLVSTIVNWNVSTRLFKVGKETDSIALMADGWHLRTDVYTSAGVMAGLAVVWLNDVLGLGWRVAWVDPVAALCVACLILKAAWDLTAQSVHDLLDTSLPAEEEAWIRDLVKAHHPQVRGMHGMRTRKGGAERFVEFHLIVDETMHVKDAHDLSERIETAIEQHFPAIHVSIHIEPCYKPCSETCLAGCLERGTSDG